MLAPFLDDDVMDPDFVLDIFDDDLTPSASGKNTHMLKFLKGQDCLLWRRAIFKRTGVWRRAI